MTYIHKYTYIHIARNFIEQRLRHRFFPMHIAKFPTASFLQSTSGWLHLYILTLYTEKYIITTHEWIPVWEFLSTKIFSVQVHVCNLAQKDSVLVFPVNFKKFFRIVFFYKTPSVFLLHQLIFSFSKILADFQICIKVPLNIQLLKFKIKLNFWNLPKLCSQGKIEVFTGHICAKVCLP